MVIVVLVVVVVVVVVSCRGAAAAAAFLLLLLLLLCCRFVGITSRPLRPQDAARRIATVCQEAKLTVDIEEYVQHFRPDMMEIVFAWCNGAKFADVCAMTKAYEGTIIRVIRRCVRVPAAEAARGRCSVMRPLWLWRPADWRSSCDSWATLPRASATRRWRRSSATPAPRCVATSSSQRRCICERLLRAATFCTTSRVHCAHPATGCAVLLLSPPVGAAACSATNARPLHPRRLRRLCCL